MVHYVDELVQEKSNSRVLAMELRLSCTNLSIWYTIHDFTYLITIGGYVLSEAISYDGISKSKFILKRYKI